MVSLTKPPQKTPKQKKEWLHPFMSKDAVERLVYVFTVSNTDVIKRGQSD